MYHESSKDDHSTAQSTPSEKEPKLPTNNDETTMPPKTSPPDTATGLHGMKKKQSDRNRYNLDVQSASDPSSTSFGWANAWVVVRSTSSADKEGTDFTSLADALKSGAKNIHLKEGIHRLDQTIVLGQNHAGLHIRGASKERTIIKYTGKESMFVAFNTRNVALSNLSLDARKANPPSNTHAHDEHEQMWQVIGVVNSSGIGVLDCIIHAPPTMHAIFFAGSFYASSRLYQPFFGDTSSRYDEGDKETVDAYRGGYLDENNAVRNNEIYSGYDGDALVFTFQRNGEVSGNRVIKGSISLYMNRDTTCRSNTVMNAPTYGIHVTLPSHNIYIDSNRIVQAGASAVRVARMDMNGGPLAHDLEQVIQPPPTVTTDERPQYRAKGIQITSNRILDSQIIGVEVEMTHGAIISDNIISRTQYSAICLQHSDQPILSDNHLEDVGLVAKRHEHNGGIYAAMAVTGAIIQDNMVTESQCHGNQFGIKIADVSENKDNQVSKNILSGKYEAGEAIVVGGDGSSMVPSANILL